MGAEPIQYFRTSVPAHAPWKQRFTLCHSLFKCMYITSHLVVSSKFLLSVHILTERKEIYIKYAEIKSFTLK